MDAPETPFIRVTEIWVPTLDRSALQFGGGHYGPHTSFRAVSEVTRFAHGEGLPGKAWAERRPIVLKQLEGSYFRRGEAAVAAGLSCGVALPIFAGDYILAVIVFFCGAASDHGGAIELWMNDPSASSQMSFVDGYYGRAELFERGSRSVFGKGYGLPGTVWETGLPVFDPELYRATRMLRPGDALKVGASTGVGLPFHHDPSRSWVITFLSAGSTPIARGFDIWVRSQDGSRLVRRPIPGETASPYRQDEVGPEDGMIGLMMRTGMPVANPAADEHSPMTAQAIEAQALISVVGVPILDRAGRLTAAASWYF